MVERLAVLEIVSGYVCGEPGEPCVPPENRPYFRPGNQISRGQITKIVNLARLVTMPTPTATASETVVSVTSTSEPTQTTTPTATGEPKSPTATSTP